MYKVLDTNILLLDANNLLTLGSSATIVLPETVLDECDSKKSGMTEIAFQAREFGRLLTRANKTDTTRTDNLVITHLELEGVQIEVVSLLKYPDFSDVEVNIINDRKIIQVALEYEQQNRTPVVFVSNDVMARLRADSLGLLTEQLVEFEKTSFDFIKRLEVTDEQFSVLHNKPILDIDPEYIHENFNYVLHLQVHLNINWRIYTTPISK